ncbi:MAG: hypothetical protein Tsb0034_07180 [Ekhidna sp.]
MDVFKKLRGADYLEIVVHACYWLFHFTSVNTSWELDWTNHQDRKGVAQLTIVLYPAIFYLNAFWLIPKLLRGNQWYRYLIVSLAIVTSIELARTMIFVIHQGKLNTFEASFINEFLSRDNLIFGLPNSLFFAFLFSSIYRFTRDWIKHQSTIAKLQSENSELSRNFEVLENSLKASNTSNGKYKSTFQAKRRDGIFILRVENISYIKAQGDFVLAFDDSGDSYIINFTLSAIEGLLDPKLFFQINRSEIVNIGFILKFTNHTKNRLEIQLRSLETPLYTSNSRSPEFRKWIDEL